MLRSLLAYAQGRSYRCPTSVRLEDQSMDAFASRTVLCYTIYDVFTAADTLQCCGIGPDQFHEASPDGDERRLLAEVQSYLRARNTTDATSHSRSSAWDTFYHRYQALVRREVTGRRSFSRRDKHDDDLCQEVWTEILQKLPGLAYSPARGGLASWLVVVARRKIRQLLGRSATKPPRFAQPIERLAESIPSRLPGPPEQLAIKEAYSRLASSLAELAGQTSRTDYEIFHRRIFQRQSVAEVAVALDLTPNEVRCRHYRLQLKWRRLTNDIVNPQPC